MIQSQWCLSDNPFNHVSCEESETCTICAIAFCGIMTVKRKKGWEKTIQVKGKKGNAVDNESVYEIRCHIQVAGV